MNASSRSWSCVTLEYRIHDSDLTDNAAGWAVSISASPSTDRMDRSAYTGFLSPFQSGIRGTDSKHFNFAVLALMFGRKINPKCPYIRTICLGRIYCSHNHNHGRKTCCASFAVSTAVHGSEMSIFSLAVRLSFSYGYSPETVTQWLPQWRRPAQSGGERPFQPIASPSDLRAYI